jgi:hypothetical protein
MLNYFVSAIAFLRLFASTQKTPNFHRGIAFCSYKKAYYSNAQQYFLPIKTNYIVFVLNKGAFNLQSYQINTKLQSK